MFSYTLNLTTVTISVTINQGKCGNVKRMLKKEEMLGKYIVIVKGMKFKIKFALG